MRDHAAEVYRVECGRPWSATTGSRTSRTLTASQIDARDFFAARASQKREAHAPSGPVVVLSGGADWTAHEALWDRLDAIKSRIPRSEEHTSELQSLMRISYAVFCLKKKKKKQKSTETYNDEQEIQ